MHLFDKEKFRKKSSVLDDDRIHPVVFQPPPPFAVPSNLPRIENRSPRAIRAWTNKNEREGRIPRNATRLSIIIFSNSQQPPRYLATAHNLLFAQFLAESRSWNWSTGWLNSTKNYSFTDRGKILPRENREREKTRIREWKKPLFPIQFRCSKLANTSRSTVGLSPLGNIWRQRISLHLSEGTKIGLQFPVSGPWPEHNLSRSCDRITELEEDGGGIVVIVRSYTRFHAPARRGRGDKETASYTHIHTRV